MPMCYETMQIMPTGLFSYDYLWYTATYNDSIIYLLNQIGPKGPITQRFTA